jgi:hypothetical protein
MTRRHLIRAANVCLEEASAQTLLIHSASNHTLAPGLYPMSLSLLQETDIRDKVLKRAFSAATRVVAEQDFKDDGYLCVLWRVQLSKIFLAPPCRARLVRYVPLPHKIKLCAKRHWGLYQQSRPRSPARQRFNGRVIRLRRTPGVRTLSGTQEPTTEVQGLMTMDIHAAASSARFA